MENQPPPHLTPAAGYLPYSDSGLNQDGPRVSAMIFGVWFCPETFVHWWC